MTLPGLDRDSVKVERQTSTSTTDAAGNPVQPWTTVLETTGTYGTPSATDVERASKAGAVLDAIVAMGKSEVQIGDRLTVVGQKWKVVGVMDVRFHQRVLLRRWS